MGHTVDITLTVYFTDKIKLKLMQHQQKEGCTYEHGNHAYEFLCFCPIMLLGLQVFGYEDLEDALGPATLQGSRTPVSTGLRGPK